MAKPQSLLARLLNTPDIERVVPHLHPAVLHRVIQHAGLEDCAEIVALATPSQLERVLDVDIWRAPGGGADEQFDADRFGLWLEVLMESGAAVAAEKVVAIDVRLVVAGLSRHLRVFDAAAVSSYTTLDGEVIEGRRPEGGFVSEIGGYFIEAKRESAWDAIVELLLCLDADHPGHFHRLMRACMRLSSGAREADGFYALLEDREQDMFDLATARETRRDREGYASPAQARAFLQSARQLRLNLEQPPTDPLSRAYFRAVASAEAEEVEATTPETAEAPQDTGAPSQVDADAMAAAFEVLREAGLLAPPRALLTAPEGHTPLVFLRSHVEGHERSAEELAYLANTMIAGGSIQGRALTSQEASEVVAAACNLGLENWPGHWDDRDLIAAFQVGWSVLHREVCIRSAEELIQVLATLQCHDRDIQLRLDGLRTELARHVRDGAPWRARNSLDAILMLDAPSWAALLGFIDKCPVVHAAADASRRLLRIDPADFTFISENSQIALVHQVMASLPEALTR